MTTAVDKVWSQQEITKAKSYFAEFQAHGDSFLKIGAMLHEFHDEQLYLIFSNSWSDFIEKSLGWKRQRGYQFLDAYEVVSPLPEECQQLLTSESAARALKPVPSAKREAVVREAAKDAPNGHVTAKAITEAAQRVLPPPSPSAKVELFDATGYAVPDSVVKLFHRVDEVKAVLQKFAETRGLMRRVEENKDMLWQPVNKSTMMSDLDRVYHELKMALPYAVCPYCQGRDETKSHCTTCKGRGVISEFIYKTAIPEELKAVREKSCKK